LDLRGGLQHLSGDTALLFIPSVLAFAVITLLLEAGSLVILSRAAGAVPGIWTCARLKAASYTAALVHYALGAGGLALLLRRHTGVRTADAVGIVLLLAVVDLAILLILTAVGAVWLSTRAPAVQGGVVAGAIVAIALGIALLRSRFPLGPLERFRASPVFRTARQLAPGAFARLATLRLAFVLAFIALNSAALASFGVSVPPGDLLVGVAAVALVSTLPIAMSGLGTGQAAFVYVFRHWAEGGVLLSCSLMISAGIISLRALMGLLFAREFTREAMSATREGETESSRPGDSG
jgi:hypothetical protein